MVPGWPERRVSETIIPFLQYGHDCVVKIIERASRHADSLARDGFSDVKKILHNLYTLAQALTPLAAS